MLVKVRDLVPPDLGPGPACRRLVVIVRYLRPRYGGVGEYESDEQHDDPGHDQASRADSLTLGRHQLRPGAYRLLVILTVTHFTVSDLSAQPRVRRRIARSCTSRVNGNPLVQGFFSAIASRSSPETGWTVATYTTRNSSGMVRTAHGSSRQESAGGFGRWRRGHPGAHPQARPGRSRRGLPTWFEEAMCGAASAIPGFEARPAARVAWPAPRRVLRQPGG